MKKVIAPLITLVIGFGIGYFVFKYNSSSTNLNPSAKDTTASNKIFELRFGRGSADKTRPNFSEPIDRTVAQNNIAQYRKLNQPTTTSIPTIQCTTGPFNGFYIDTATFNKILSSDKTLSGVSFYIGVHPYYAGQGKSILSIYLTGARPLSNGTAQFENPANSPVYEYVDPCPTACGTLAP